MGSRYVIRMYEHSCIPHNLVQIPLQLEDASHAVGTLLLPAVWLLDLQYKYSPLQML
jgi:hypothetical protein